MEFKKEFTAGIIIIGNEILSGRTVDKNTSFIATWLNDRGISVEETRVIPDKEKIIIDTVRELKRKFAYIFTTGGIGPTHDDITAESISKVFGQKYQYHPEAYKILEKFYKNQDFNDGRKKMAKMPEHAKLIPNPKTFAAGFYVENVFVLPGVPSILQAMIPQLDNIIKTGKKILSSSIDTGLRESLVAEGLSRLQDKYKNIDIGSYPYFKEKPGTVLVLRTTEKELLKKCEEEVKKLVLSLS
ncbi:MAG: competence/damage-inducible protein A [Pelagibacteraceae bacterium]|nr:competence/damage-inducible protein A [Pelagibacteraceae bacterium]|tara:strand:- start:791 stop:1519 length:729 start_codon:yes stop_codon:yes gene_type:complete